jgi:hypothetical protein
MIRNSLRLGAAALAALAASLGPAAIAQAKQQNHCRPAGSQTLAFDSYARVYGLNGNAYVCIKSSGKRTLLQNATPGTDQFAVGGKWVGWSSSSPTDPTILPHSILTVMHIPNHFVNGQWYPFQTNQPIAKIAVISDGAAAWALDADPNDNTTNAIIQGTDRQNHPADQFSDDSEGSPIVGSSLHVVGGKTVGWSYADGTTGTQALY